MARNIVYAGNEAYQLGYKDGHKDGFYEGQQMSAEEGYKHAMENACEWLKEHAKAFGCADGMDAVYIYDTDMLEKAFRKAMNYE